jgi:hypothetical protein
MKKKLKTFFAAFFATNLTLFGGTKALTVIENFAASESPDSVTFSWKVRAVKSRIVRFVMIQRRLKGATEEEAWEYYGKAASGDAENLTVEGFTLDNDYEYRAVAVSEVVE